MNQGNEGSGDFNEIEETIRKYISEEGACANWLVSENVIQFCEKKNIIITGDVLHVLRTGRVTMSEPSTRTKGDSRAYRKYAVEGESPSSEEERLRVWVILSTPKDRTVGIKILEVEKA